jgi:pyrimidine-nucleoside phosphorylase/thymidine phosphorylase
MGVPLGVTVGNALEVHEAVDVLMGQGPKDVRDLTIELCAEMILLARPDQTVHLDHARQEAARTLDRGKALEKFRELILAQGGNPEPVLSKELPISPDRTVISSQADGFVGSMDMRAIGDAACLLGAGRQLATDSVDHGVGLEILIRPGQAISVGQPMAVLYHRDGKGLTEATTRLIKAIPINSAPPLVHTLILERITV